MEEERATARGAWMMFSVHHLRVYGLYNNNNREQPMVVFMVGSELNSVGKQRMSFKLN